MQTASQVPAATDSVSTSDRYRTPTVAVVATIGRGGSMIHYDCTGSAYSSSSCQGYSMTPAELVRDHPELPDDLPIADLTPMPDLITFAISGPMVDPATPAGMVSKLGVGRVPWVADGGPFGNARGLDCVAVDVYLTLVERHGGIVTTVGAVRS